MATGINYDGKVVQVNDSVTIMGSVTALSGTAPEFESITVQTIFGDNIVCQPGDLYVPESAGSVGGVVTYGNFVVINTTATVFGVVTSITGTGQNAQLTVTLAASSLSVVVTAGSVRSTGH